MGKNKHIYRDRTGKVHGIGYLATLEHHIYLRVHTEDHLTWMSCPFQVVGHLLPVDHTTHKMGKSGIKIFWMQCSST